MDRTIEQRLRAVEDQLAIYQLVSAYGYAVDGCNAPVVGSLYAPDGVYAVGDYGTLEGRDAIEGITAHEGHLALVKAGCGHLSTLPHIVLDGDRAVATCHTMVVQNDGEDSFFIGRLSASRLQLSRGADGQWRIDHRQNHLLRGDGLGSALLGQLTSLY